jgi:HAD superfamily hydrolase (TIGR01458 family)
MNLTSIELFLLDMDGVLLVGKGSPRLVSGLKLVDRIRETKKKLFILTNNTTHTRDSILRKLRKLNFEIEQNEILSACHLTAEYLYEHYSSSDCFLIGEPGFATELRRMGHRIVTDNAGAVVVGIDRHLTYDKLNRAIQVLKNGAHLVAAHKSRFYMDEEGPMMAPGPIVAALEYATGRRAVSIGKPSAPMFKMAMHAHSLRPHQVLMVGDQVETDVLGAKRLGIPSALVMTGVEDESTLAKSSVSPDLILEDADELVRFL